MSKKHRGHAKGDPVTYQTPLPAGGVQMETFLPWTLVRRGLKKQVITPFDAPQEFLDEARRERQVREMAQDTPLMRALGLAHHWQRLLDDGTGVDLGERWNAVVAASVALTELPMTFGPAHVARLRAAGLDELAIADAIQAAAFFNWANRLMLSLGEPTPQG